MTDTLLEAADEIRLAKTIEAGLLAGELLARADFSFAPAAELLQVEQLGRDAWQQFLLANVRLVQSLRLRRLATSAPGRPRRAVPGGLSRSGRGGAAVGLTPAGYRFSTYAMPWIRRRVH